jgi:hypothetical protein
MSDIEQNQIQHSRAESKATFVRFNCIVYSYILFARLRVHSRIAALLRFVDEHEVRVNESFTSRSVNNYWTHSLIFTVNRSLVKCGILEFILYKIINNIAVIIVDKISNICDFIIRILCLVNLNRSLT